MCQDFVGDFWRDERAEPFAAGSLEIGYAAEFPQQLLDRARPDARDIAESRFRLPLATPLPMKGDGEAVGLIANLLN